MVVTWFAVIYFAVMQFVSDYVLNDNLTAHFIMPPCESEALELYWISLFAECLDRSLHVQNEMQVFEWLCCSGTVVQPAYSSQVIDLFTL